MDSPKLTIVESPASPITDSPASPTLESPASPVIESPASPTPETSTAVTPKKAYTPVVIPTVSTVTITRRDPRTAASRFTASSGGNSSSNNTNYNQAAPYAPVKDTPTSQSARPPSAPPPPKALPKSILMKPSSSTDPRLYGTSSRMMVSQPPTDGDTAQFLSKQQIIWKGFLNMLSVAKFVTKAYLVSGSAENLKTDLPDTIQIGGRILPETVWDYVDKLKTSVTKELCVIRFHPATEEEEVAYVSLFSYFSSRGRFGVVANISRSIKDVYLVPLSANVSIPSILQPLEGLEKNRPNLLLGLAIVQKAKRPGSLHQEIEEKKPKVNVSKDPMWIPKPPVLYGSDKLEMFQPYDPETPASSSPLVSPSCPGSPSDSSSSSSVTMPSLFSASKAAPSVLSIATTESSSSSKPGKNSTPATNDKTPLQTILKTLFSGKQSKYTTSTVSTHGSAPKAAVKTKRPLGFSQVSGSMVDPIVQQYGQKSKGKEMEENEKVVEKENDFDRPYDPEEEYDPAMTFQLFPPQTTEQIKSDDPAVSALVEDDVAYDPEDETIFDEFQSDTTLTKPHVSTQILDSPSCPTPVSSSGPAQSSNPVLAMQNLPTGTIVVSAATLSEQQRMLEELNKQIEEQKRQLKEQEEVLRQQREAVGMFMARFSVSDTLMSPPEKTMPLSQLSYAQCGKMQIESKTSDKTDKTNIVTETADDSKVDSETVKLKDTSVSSNVKDNIHTAAGQKGTQENVKEYDKNSSAGEIEDSDVAYDPEDESLFDEIQDDVFKGGITMTNDSSSKACDSVCYKSASPDLHPSKKQRSSPKKRSHHERDHHRSPSRKLQQRSHSHSRRHRDRERHRRSERDRSRHRTRDSPERSGQYHKEHGTHRHSRGRRRSPSSPQKKPSTSLSPKCHREPFSQVTEKTKHAAVPCSSPASVIEKHSKSKILPLSLVNIKSDPDGQKSDSNPLENTGKHSLELIPNVKSEVSDSLICQENETGKKSVGHYNSSVSVFNTQENKSSLKVVVFHDKYENTVPLREIDPPTRDSPESPDPEPQFVKPSSTGENDCVKTEEIHDPEKVNSDSVQLNKNESNYVPLAGLAFGSAELKTDPVAMLSGSGTRFQDSSNSRPDMKESEHKEMHIDQGEPRFRLPGPGPGFQDPFIDDQGKGVMQQKTCVQYSLSNTKESSIQCQSSNRPYSWTVERGSSLDTKNLPLQDINQNKEGPYSDILQNLGPSVSNSISEFCIQNERGNALTKGQLSDKPVADKGMLGPRDSLSAVHCNTDTRGLGIAADQNVYIVNLQDLQYLKSKDFQAQSENLDSWSGMVTKGIPSFEKKVFEPHGRDAGFSIIKSENMTNFTTTNWRETGPTQNSQIKSLEVNLDQNVPRSNIGDAWKGPDWRETDPVRTGLFSQDDWSNHQSDRRRSNVRSQGPDREGISSLEHRDQESQVGPNMHNLKRDHGGSVGPDFMGPRPERRGPEMLFTRHDRRDVMGPGIFEQKPERSSLPMNIAGPDSKVPQGPDLMRPGLDGRSLAVESHGFDRRELTGPNFMRPWPERGGPNIDCPKPDKRSPNIEGLGNDCKRPGGPDFRGTRPDNKRPMPEMEGAHMEGPGTERSGPRFPDFRGTRPDNKRPMPEMEGARVEGPGTERSRPRCPDFRGTRPDNKRPMLEMEGAPVEGPGTERSGPRCLDFRGVVPESRGFGAEQYRTRPGDMEFRRSGHDRGNLTMEDSVPQNRGGPVFRGPGHEIRSSMENFGSERKIPGGTDLCEPGPHMKSHAMGSQRIDRKSGGPDFSRPVSEMRGPIMDSQDFDRGGPNIWGPGSERRRPEDYSSQGEPYCKGDGTEGRYPILEDSVHNRKGPDLRAPGSDIAGPALNQRRLGGPGIVRPAHQHENFNTIKPRSDDRCQEYSNVKESWPEEGSSDMNQTDNNSFPRVPRFRCPESGQAPSEMESLHSERRGAHFGSVGPNRTIMRGRGPVRKGRRVFRRPINESRIPDIEGPVAVVNKQNSGGPCFRESAPDRLCPDVQGSESNWTESSDLDFGGQGIRQHQTNAEGPRYNRQNDWEETEPISESSDLEFAGSDRARRMFRPSWPVRGRSRGQVPNFRGSTPYRGRGNFEGQRSDRRGSNIEAFRNERGHPGDNLVKRGNMSSGPFQDGTDEQGQGDGMQFPGSIQGPGDDWRGPSCKGSESFQESSHESFSGPSRRGQRHEWREPDREGSGPVFRGRGGPGYRGQICDRGQGGGRGSSSHRQFYVGDDSMQQDFKGNMKGPNTHLHGSHHRRGPGGMNPCPNRRAFEMEEQGEPDSRCPEPGYEYSENEGQGTDEGNSEFGGLESERYDVGMSNPGTEFEHHARRERRGPKLGHGPTKADMKRWDTNVEFAELDRRHPDLRNWEQEQRGYKTSTERRGPHHVDESLDSSEKCLAPFNRSHGPGPNRGGPQNQQAGPPHKLRGALLPTPTESPLSKQRAGNQDVFGLKTQEFGHPVNREPSRGRAVDYRFRGRGRGLRRGIPARFRAMGGEEEMEEGN